MLKLPTIFIIVHFSVYTDIVDRNQLWRNKLKQRSDYSERNMFILDGGRHQKDFRFPYTGCEALSVLVIMDDCCCEQIVAPIVNVAMSRAQYEVCVLLHLNFNHLGFSFIRRKPFYLQLMKRAVAQLTESDEVYLNSVEGRVDLVMSVLSAVYDLNSTLLKQILLILPKWLKPVIALDVLRQCVFCVGFTKSEVSEIIEQEFGEDVRTILLKSAKNCTIDSIRSNVCKAYNSLADELILFLNVDGGKFADVMSQDLEERIKSQIDSVRVEILETLDSSEGSRSRVAVSVKSNLNNLDRELLKILGRNHTQEISRRIATCAEIISNSALKGGREFYEEQIKFNSKW